MKTKHLSVALGLATLVSCGQGNNQSTADNEITQLENELKNIDPKAKGDNTCLLAYAEKYGELLTKDMVAEATGTSADVMTTRDSKIHSDTKYHHIQHSWKTGRIKNINGMNIPVDDYVKLTGIEAISLSTFQLSYRAVSEEETRKINEDMNEALDGNSDNSAVTQAIKKLDEMGISKEEQQKMVKDLTESAQTMTKGFAKVDNLGQSATWNAKTNTLYVFEKGAMFELVVELSDSGRNMEVATALARQILDKCK